MTYGEIKSRVMDRLNLSSPEAETRIGGFINERYRELATSIGMAPVRRATVPLTAVDGTATLATTALIKPFVLVPDEGNFPPLGEITVDQLRNRLPRTATGRPREYAVTNFSPSGCTLEFCPTPDDDYVFNADGLVPGIDLEDDADVPAFPEDFHDALISGALADEYAHFEKYDYAKAQEVRYASRKSALRYFIAKSAYLKRRQGGTPSPLLWLVRPV